MKTAFKKPQTPFPSNLRENALLYLVFFTAVCYIILHTISIIFMVIHSDATKTVMSSVIEPQVAIKDWSNFIHKPWTAFTYFLGDTSFWYLVSNMLWLYCFGSIIQSLIGYREIMPLYFITSIVAAIVYCCFTYAWPQIASDRFIMNAQCGTMAMAVAAITLAPSYRYYIGDRFSIPLVIVFGIYLLLNVASFIQSNPSMLALLGIAALSGYGYMRMLQNGIRPGKWIYGGLARIENSFTPNQEKVAIANNKIRKQTLQNIRKNQHHYSEEYIDAILDKINSKGYNSLTPEEKEDLFKASREEF